MALETSLPGVFAVGDVRHNSVKRVASAGGAGAMAIAAIHAYLAETAGMIGRARGADGGVDRRRPRPESAVAVIGRAQVWTPLQAMSGSRAGLKAPLPLASG